MASKMAASVWADLRNCVNSSIFFSNTSFQLFLWSVSPCKLLPDNVKQYLAPLHEGFQLAT